MFTLGGWRVERGTIGKVDGEENNSRKARKESRQRRLPILCILFIHVFDSDFQDRSVTRKILFSTSGSVWLPR